jgi:hypothetical protein
MIQKNRNIYFVVTSRDLSKISKEFYRKIDEILKKIAYIELDTHAEIALNFMELMNDSKVFSVDYYFSEKILKTLGLKESENIKKTTSENLIK